MGPRYLADISGIFTCVQGRTAPTRARWPRCAGTEIIKTYLNSREGEAHPLCLWSHRVSMPCAQGRERGGRWEGHHRTRAASTTLRRTKPRSEASSNPAASRALGKERERERACAWYGHQTMTTTSCITPTTTYNNNNCHQTITTTPCTTTTAFLLAAVKGARRRALRLAALCLQRCGWGCSRLRALLLGSHDRRQSVRSLGA